MNFKRINEISDLWKRREKNDGPIKRTNDEVKDILSTKCRANRTITIDDINGYLFVGEEEAKHIMGYAERSGWIKEVKPGIYKVLIPTWCDKPTKGEADFSKMYPEQDKE